jgi:hypothetical protein
MASESALITAIERKVVTPSVWTIGVTDDLGRRRKKHGNPILWYHWDADTEQDARAVEAYFVEKGLKGDTGGGGGADYVYIFLKSLAMG